jgi:hypothetical protein
VIRLAHIGQNPKEGGRWLAGKNEMGQVATLGLNDNTPHWLLAGQTGSGKSVGMLAAGVQLGKDYDNRLILLDGKYGVDLRQVARLPTLMGPLVKDVDGALSALAWAVRDMRRRYEHRDPSRLIILWDEPQEWLADNAVHNLETAQVYRLGKPRSADPQQVTASGQVRALGVTAQAAERIGKSTKDAQAADAIPGLTGAIPLVLPAGESQTLIIGSDTSETVDL